MTELESRLRDLINTPRVSQALRAHPRRWNAVCSAMDMLGDTTLAINAYRRRDPTPTDHGEIYLGIYGILQIMVVQQDAIQVLAKQLDLGFELPTELAQIRSVRVSSVGHPADIRAGSERFAAFISRPTLSWQGFDLWVAGSDGHECKHVGIHHLLEVQERAVSELLRTMIKHLEDEELEHRRKYRAEPLASAFDSHMPYPFEKLREGIRNPVLRSLAEWGLDHVARAVDELAAAVRERGVDDGYVGIAPSLEEVRRPIQRLRDYLGDVTGLEPDDAIVYSHHLQQRVQGLSEIAREIDDEYASDEV